MLAGYPDGADGIGYYTAACLHLVLLADEMAGTEFTVTPTGRTEFLRAIGIGIGADAASMTSAEDELEAMRAEAAAKAASRSQSPPTE